MADLPSGTLYGTVVGQFIQAVADGTDANRNPDMKPVQGAMTFTPSATKVTLPNASPNPMTMFQSVIPAALDSEGYIVGPDGQRGLVLIASDSPGNPTQFTYTVSLSLVGVPGFTFSFYLPAGQTIDLTTVMPAEASGGALLTTDDIMTMISSNPSSKFALQQQAKLDALKLDTATAAQGAKADAALPASRLGVANGAASLDADSTVPVIQLPTYLSPTTLDNRFSPLINATQAVALMESAAPTAEAASFYDQVDQISSGAWKP